MVITTIKCDCCLKELDQSEMFSLTHYIHVNSDYNALEGQIKRIDGNSWAISGRQVTKDFCLPCYNRLFYAFYEEVKEIQGVNQVIV